MHSDSNVLLPEYILKFRTNNIVKYITRTGLCKDTTERPDCRLDISWVKEKA